MRDFDVIIVGGGIAGASVGAEIAGDRRTLIVEAEAHCGYHSTGRSAAFWLESYGGPKVALLSGASRAFLDAPPPEFADQGFLRERGAVHLSQDGWPEIPDGVSARKLSRAELNSLIPGLRAEWGHGLLEPGCADIDVAALHAAYLRAFRRAGGQVAANVRLAGAEFRGGRWYIESEDGSRFRATVLVNAAGAWADGVARLSGIRPIGVAPRRRTMVQLRVGRSGLRDLPLIDDASGTFYFKGEGDRSVWLSPHDESASDPCDAAPEEIDVATAIDRFQQVVDWPVEHVERSWAGLRSFAPDRLPVYGFDAAAPGFFWCAGQGGFGIQTAPAAGKLAASVLLGQALPGEIAHIDPATFSPARFA
jgi:D-arginine dehydrogenase